MNQKKIAKLAHVSTSTVSKALSGSSEISNEIAQEIRRIAIESGYFTEKNTRRRKYANNKSLLIALIVPEIISIHYSAIATYIKNEVESLGGHVAIYVSDFNNNKCNEILETLILPRSCDGVIVFSNAGHCAKYNVPIICFSNKGTGLYDSIGNDTNAILYDAVKHLKDLGHKKIGFVGELYTLSKSDSFKSAIKQLDLCYNEEFVYIIDGRFETIGVDAARLIAASKEKPTAIIAAYDEIALALIHELSNNNIQVPSDISIMGINNIPASSYAQIPLTTVETFSAEQYKTAIDLLFDKIVNQTDVVKHITVQHKIIQRDSTRHI